MNQFLKNSDWHGRENELVNLFAHRFLAEHVSHQGPLYSMRQVGIEVAVPQVTGSRKEFVRKDLVIWPKEDMTAWPSGSIPSVIIEWKRENRRKWDADVVWLKLFRARFPETLCYVACGILKSGRGVEFELV